MKARISSWGVDSPGSEPVRRAPVPGAEFEARIDDVTADGAGVARTGSLVVFVPGAAPGDWALVRLKRIRRGWAEGELVRILGPSPDRRPAPCPHQAACGGCPLMVLDPAAALAVKARHLREVLRRVGKVDLPVDRVLPSPLALGYRGRVRFAVAPHEAGAWFGYHPQGRPRIIVPVTTCLLAPPRASALARDFIAGLHRRAEVSPAVWPTHLSLRGSLSRGEWLLVPHTGEGPWPEGEAVARELLPENGDLAGVVRVVESAGRPTAEHVLAGRDTVLERIGEVDVDLGARTFLQVNPGAAVLLYNEVRLALAGTPSPRKLLDLYCGAGLIGLLAVDRDVDVVGVEVSPRTVEQARSAVQRAQRGGMEIRAGDAVAVARGLAAAGVRFDRVTLNPPRAGAGADLARAVRDLGARVVVMISCHPAALARDLARFVAVGFAVTGVAAVDMFPQTPHLEAVARLEARP